MTRTTKAPAGDEAAIRARKADTAPVEPVAPDAVFSPVRSHTAFEETVDRLGTAISLGLLAPGSRLPAERELCARLGISRSTLRQALTALTQSGHVFATRGRAGGTFVSDPLPPSDPPSPEMLARWRETCDQRLAVELGVSLLAAERARPEALEGLERLASALDGMLEDFSAYRQTDVRLHVCLAQATGSPPLVRAMTDAQGAMTDLLAHIAHPPEVLASSNAQHHRLLAAIRERDGRRAVQVMTQHLQGTEHVLAGLLPSG
ncbi:MAG TPA: FCD domain-containing protein [Solirubrobacteraceae bacterium]|nr:FCD domain-containing protein [Solirubrobacteraceae bacterium]